MDIAEEFKLKEIKKAWYAPNKRKRVKTESGKVQVQKHAVRNDVAKRDKYVAKRKTILDKINKRQKAVEEHNKNREEVMLWTLREAIEYLGKYDVSAETRLTNVVSNIVVGKYENDKR